VTFGEIDNGLIANLLRERPTKSPTRLGQQASGARCPRGASGRRGTPITGAGSYIYLGSERVSPIDAQDPWMGLSPA
jgi:hypothetical protein